MGPEEVVTAKISFTLNGRAFEFEGEMPARESSSWVPLLIDRLGR